MLGMTSLKRLLRPRLLGVLGVFAIAMSVALTACADVPAASQSATPVPAAVTATAIPMAQATAAPQATPIPQPTQPTPILTSTPVATPTPTAVSDTPTPIPTSPDVERLAAKGMELLTRFTEDYSPRRSGSSGEAAAARFIGDYLEELGYSVEFQPVDVEYIPWDDRFIVLAGEDMPELRAMPLAKTGHGDVIAPIVSVGKAFEDDIPEDGLQGAIALIERGEITFQEKVNRVADAGAVAAIIYNNERGNFRGALQSDGPIPAASLSREQGEEVLRLLEEEPGLEARMRIETSLLFSQNVIAENVTLHDESQPHECGVAVMGAHYDSVANTQAAGDNGTGVVSLLIIAEEILDDPLPVAVRFVFFGVEEIGLYGSKHYVDTLSDKEREDIIAMLNFDAMGMGEASVEGSAELADIAVTFAAENGIALKRRLVTEGLGSDHVPFLEVDIPALFFFGDDFSIINSPDDVLEKVEPSIMGAHLTVALGMLQKMECKN